MTTVDFGLRSGARFKERSLDWTKRVWVYRNLSKNCYSLMQNGLVIGHTDKVLLQHVEFKVRTAGWKRVLKTRKKNVHAFAVGHCLIGGTYKTTSSKCTTRIKYNPYVSKYFHVDGTDYKYPVFFCEYLLLDERGMFAVL